MCKNSKRDLRLNLPQPVRVVLDRLYPAEAYLVGGCARDLILGLVPKDYDITTELLPERVAELFADFTVVETGLKHGTVTVVIDKFPVEVTTYRTDGTYSDNRRPDSVTFTRNLTEDLARRDFTANAIALDNNGNLVDPYNGQADLNHKILRCVGDADMRFNEDALRILRGLRFACVYGFTIETATANAMHDNRELIFSLSGERKYGELMKFLMGKGVAELLTEYADVFACVIPEIADCKNFNQRNHYHCYDVLTHIAHSVSYSPRDKACRFSMLLHDIGKPAAYLPKKGIDNTIVGHFPGHAEKSVETALRVTQELHFDKKTQREILTTVRAHDMRMSEKETVIKRQLREYGERKFFLILAAHIADDKAKQPEVSRVEMYERIKTLAREIVQREDCYKISQLKISGTDLAELGFKGEKIGVCLEKLLSAVIDGHCENKKENLENYAFGRHWN